MKLTKIQQKIINTLEKSISNDESLSLRDIAEKVGVASANAVLYQIKKLEKAGIVKRNSGGKVIGVMAGNANNAFAFLPLLGQAACGIPLEKIEQERMIPVPLGLLGKKLKHNLYMVKAFGDSMSPKIQNGDYIIFDPEKDPENGSIVVARTPAGFTIKVFKTAPREYILEPVNKEFKPLVFAKDSAEDDFIIDGVAVGVFKPQQNL